MGDTSKIEITAETVVPVLRTLLGRTTGVKACDLVAMITGHDSTSAEERLLRGVIKGLRMEGLPACATPDDGYFWGINDDEVWETCRHLTRRSLTGLTQAAKMTGHSIPELVGKLTTEQMEKANG